VRARMNQRVLIVLLTAGVAAAAARVAEPAHQRQAHAAAVCGVERWAVKTLQDRPRLLRAQATTIAHLSALRPPASLPQTRLSFERHVFTVTASSRLIREEADQDLHVVIQTGRAHMIVEAPNAPICTPNATATRKRQMRAARRGVLAHPTCARARVTGVAFFDSLHGQTGVAPNGIELHPILGFNCLSRTKRAIRRRTARSLVSRRWSIRPVDAYPSRHRPHREHP
jgi:hypothetical protein